MSGRELGLHLVPVCPTHYSGFGVSALGLERHLCFPHCAKTGDEISSVKFKSRLDEMSLIAINPVPSLTQNPSHQIHIVSV